MVDDVLQIVEFPVPFTVNDPLTLISGVMGPGCCHPETTPLSLLIGGSIVGTNDLLVDTKRCLESQLLMPVTHQA